MSRTLIQLVTEFCNRTGLRAPSTVVSTNDLGALQFRGLLNEVLEDLVLSRGQPWKELQKETTFTSVAAELQGTIASIAPYGFIDIAPNTLYDRSTRLPLYGPMDPGQYQQYKALGYTAPTYSYRVWQGNFYMLPAPPAGRTIAFEYTSSYAVQNGSTWKAAFDDDNDTCPISDSILLAGLRWTWKRDKGLAFVTDKQSYEALVAQAMGKDSTQKTLNMAGCENAHFRPAVIVSTGNWEL
jgi:hypothetical protein